VRDGFAITAGPESGTANKIPLLEKEKRGVKEKPAFASQTPQANDVGGPSNRGNEELLVTFFDKSFLPKKLSQDDSPAGPLCE